MCSRNSKIGHFFTWILAVNYGKYMATLGGRTVVVNPSDSHSKHFCKASDSESIRLVSKTITD